MTEPPNRSDLRLSVGVAIVTGLLQCLVFRNYSNADGLNYLDVADAWLTRAPAEAVNAYWGPAYSWVLAVGRLVVGPGTRHDLPMAHAVNFLLFLCLLAVGDRLLRAETRSAGSADRVAARSLGALVVAAVSTLGVHLRFLTPDLLLCVLVAGAYALERERPDERADERAERAAWRGVLWGLAFLTKTIALYAFAAAMLARVLLARERRGATLRRAAVSAATFALVAGPWILLVSRAQGHLSTGTTGAIAYQQEVLGAPRAGVLAPRDTAAVDASLPGLAPAADLLWSRPWIVAFHDSVPGLNPIQHDVSRWHVTQPRMRFSVDAQMRNFYEELRSGWLAIAGALGLLVASVGLQPDRWKGFLATWRAPLAATTVVAGLYLLVLYESRYLAPFLLPLVLVALAECANARRVHAATARAVHVAVLCVAIAGVIRSAGRSTTALMAEAAGRLQDRDATLVTLLRAAGARPGDRVAVIGDSWDTAWVRPLGLRIAAASLSSGAEGALARLAAPDRERLRQRLRDRGVRFLVVARLRRSAVEEGMPPTLREQGLLVEKL